MNGNRFIKFVKILTLEKFCYTYVMYLLNHSGFLCMSPCLLYLIRLQCLLRLYTKVVSWSAISFLCKTITVMMTVGRLNTSVSSLLITRVCVFCTLIWKISCLCKLAKVCKLTDNFQLCMVAR